MIAIRGNTYPVRDQLKALGGRWSGTERAWMFYDHMTAEIERARAIVDAHALNAAVARAKPRKSGVLLRKAS